MSANYNKKISDTEVRLGEVRFSYCNVFAPKAEGTTGGGKYSCCILIPKTDKETVAMAKEAIEAAMARGKTEKWGNKIPANVKNPLRDGDIDREDSEDYAGCYFINCSGGRKPGIRVLENGSIVEALDEEDFYSGCYGAITINFYPYDANGNRGVAAGLNHVVKTRDGERLSGGTSADAAFGDLADMLS